MKLILNSCYVVCKLNIMRCVLIPRIADFASFTSQIISASLSTYVTLFILQICVKQGTDSSWFTKYLLEWISVETFSLFPCETNGCRLTLKSTFNNPFLPQLLRSSAKTDPFIFDLIWEWRSVGKIVNICSSFQW